MNPEIRTLSVGALTRVEGEGALHVTLADGAVESVQLNIYEPPRFFEAFLRGRAYTEPPDITARVCGYARSPIRSAHQTRSKTPVASPFLPNSRRSSVAPF